MTTLLTGIGAFFIVAGIALALFAVAGFVGMLIGFGRGVSYTTTDWMDR